MREAFPDHPPRAPFRPSRSPVYFVTFCTHHRASILANDPLHEQFIAFGIRARDEFNIAIGRYVIMPDHIHFFLSGPSEFDLGRWIKSLKQTLGRVLQPQSASDQIWQEGFFDHILRHDESMAQKWEYVCDNPARAGLVTQRKDWRYQGEIVPIDRA